MSVISLSDSYSIYVVCECNLQNKQEYYKLEIYQTFHFNLMVERFYRRQYHRLWQNFICPSFDDRVLEVVAVFNSVQLGMSRVFNPQRHRIAQVRQLLNICHGPTFCRAMLCISAAYAVVRCLSVCHVRVFCQNEQTHLQFFSPSGTHTILVFLVPNIMAVFRREPPNGGVECRWGRQNRDFRRTSG